MATAITRDLLIWTFRPLVAASSSLSKRGGRDTSILRITSVACGWRMVMCPNISDLQSHPKVVIRDLELQAGA